MSAPILVTGVPRSGTTWLARVLATSPRTALAGREPMNPRGRQYALGGTLQGWAGLSGLSMHQRLALQSAYRGCNPLVFGRYGRQQWAAPLPWVRVVVKDPFALLSLPVIARTTGALPVVLFRHPGAVLVSYKRMGWQPDLDELQSVLAAHSPDAVSSRLRDIPPRAKADPLVAMGWFWSTLYDFALNSVEAAGTETIVVSHEELAEHGAGGGRELFRAIGLPWGRTTTHEFSQSSESAPQDPTALHNLRRSAHEVASGWRNRLTESEISSIEEVTYETRLRLDLARLPVTMSLS